MLVTLSKMAEHLEVSPRTLRREIKAKSIPYKRVGRQMRFEVAVVSAYFNIVDAASSNVVTFTPSKKGERSKFAEAL